MLPIEQLLKDNGYRIVITKHHTFYRLSIVCNSHVWKFNYDLFNQFVIWLNENNFTKGNVANSLSTSISFSDKDEMLRLRLMFANIIVDQS